MGVIGTQTHITNALTLISDAPLPTPPRHATSRKQTKAGKESNNQDQKPEVKPDVGSSTPQAPRIITVLDHSDESDEDESPEEEAARMEAIRKHKVSFIAPSLPLETL